jgi:replicative DNA helicase
MSTWPAPNPLLAAEQAVLGSVLLEPDQLARLDWLAPEDFYRPAHGVLFAALRKLRADGHPAVSRDDAVPLSWLTDAVEEAGHHVRGLNVTYTHALVASCPHPAHAPVYARMVLDGAIHRTVAEHAVRLHQVARADAVQGEVEGVLHHADVLAGVLADLARRWGSELSPLAPATTSATAPAGPLARMEQVVEDEHLLLAVLVDQPGALDEVAAWLMPGDFADPAHGRLYRCLGALHHRGEPTDRITVLWEAQRRGLLADGTLTAERIDAICNSPGTGSAEWLGERVLRSSVTRTAAASARAIRALADDGALAPGRLIGHALHALGPLDDVRARWRSASGEQPRVPSAPAAPLNPATSVRVNTALARSTTRRPMASTPAPQSVPAPAARPAPGAAQPDHACPSHHPGHPR